MITAPKYFIIYWKDLDKWTIPQHLLFSTNLPRGWSLVRVGDVVQQITEREKVVPEKEYKMVGVRWYGEGTFLRETLKGTSLSAGYVTPLVPNAFIYNRLFAWKGSFAVVPDEFTGCFVSNEFPQFIVDQERILSHYLYLFFMCESTIKAVNKISIGSAAVRRNRFKEEDFLNIEIPLPPVFSQQLIIKKWQNTKEENKSAIERVVSLEHKISEKAISDVGIIVRDLKKRGKLFIVPWGDTDRWGVEFNRWHWKLADLLISEKYPMVSLDVVAFLNPTNIQKLNDDDDEVSFVPMEAVSEKSGEIISPQIKSYGEVKNGFTVFKNGDVIWAKITPCMQNGKCAVAKDLVNGVGFGSTEFHVIRTKDNNKLLPEYIWLLLRLDHLRQAAQRYFIGSAGQQRVPPEFLSGLHIPLPPISQQYEIVRQVKKGFLEISKEREIIEQKSQEIKEEIEALILGTKEIT